VAMVDVGHDLVAQVLAKQERALGLAGRAKVARPA